MRERRLLAALERGERSRAALLAEAWDDVPAELLPAAAMVMEAHLEKLEAEGRLPGDLRPEAAAARLDWLSWPVSADAIDEPSEDGQRGPGLLAGAAGTGLAAAGDRRGLALAGAPAAAEARAARSSSTGCEGPVRVRRDRWGVPAHRGRRARRPLVRRGLLPRARTGSGRWTSTAASSRGRLSEIAGAEGLPVDRLMRTLGIRRAAEREAAALDPELRAAARALLRGRQRRRRERQGAALRDAAAAPRVRALAPGRHPQPRQAARLRPLDQLGAGAAARRHGARARPGAGRQARPDLPGRQPDRHPGSLVAATGSRSSSRSTPCGARSGSPPRPAAPTTGRSPATLSATGSPLIAGDPHLPPSMPGIWYQVGLALGDRFVRGASLPGMPGVYMGQNNDVCWTFTNVMADVQDLFVERIEGDRYLFEDEWRPLEIVREEIPVKGRDRARAARGAHHPPRPDRQRGARRRRRRAAGAALADARRADRLRRHVRAARDRAPARSWSRGSRATPRPPRT